MKFSYNLVAAAAALVMPQLAAADCTTSPSGVTNSAGVAINAIGGDSTGDCLCASSFYWNGTDCASVGGTGSCNIAQPTDTASTMSMQQVTVAQNMDGGSDLVPFTLQLPMYAGRAYTDLFVAPLANDTASSSFCRAGSLFNQFAAPATAATVGSDCADQWSFKVHFKDLISCGFAADNTASLQNSTYITYSGNFVLKYTEKIIIGQTQGLTTPADRTVTVVFPVAILLQSQYTFPMTVTSTKVYTNLDVVDWAIVGQYIPKGSSNYPTANIRYTVQKPYAVQAYDTITCQDSTNGISGACAYINASIPAQPTYACTASDYTGPSNTCTGPTSGAGDLITFITARGSANACKFSGYVYRVPYAVNCYASIAGSADCPLQAPDTSSYVDFTVTSENFCSDQADQDLINGVISVPTFRSVQVNNHTATQNAWVWNNVAIFHMKFAGLNVSSVTMNALKTKLGATDDDNFNANFTSGTTDFGTASSAPGWQASGSPQFIGGNTPGANQPTQNVDSFWTGGLGLHQDTQDYYFTLQVGDVLLGGSGNVPARGSFKKFAVQATFTVTYNTVYRRRRRQASQEASGSGTKASDVQTVSAPEQAAVAPANSAVRATPAVAFVLALISAAALL